MKNCPEFHRLPFKTLVLTLVLLGNAGCQQGGNPKSVFDLVQFLLNQDGMTRWLTCVGLMILFFQGLKLCVAAIKGVWWTLRTAKDRLWWRWGCFNLSIAVFLGSMLALFSEPLSDMLQELEQSWRPAYVGQYDYLTEGHLVAMYESELAKYTDDYELGIIKKRTGEIAAKINSSPLAIYECAYVECGLNPFTIRKDEVAAGWIQFTKVGLSGLLYQGRKVTMQEVMQACRQRNAEFIMDMTEIYLVKHHEIAGFRPLNNTIDLYLALFAPALIGAAHDKVVYQGFSNPSYYLNKGLDGWFTQSTADGRQQILRRPSACDGKITIWEIYLALNARKARLTRQHLKSSSAL
jgi:hypothetical protein